jgi:hypothetical protein
MVISKTSKKSIFFDKKNLPKNPIFNFKKIGCKVDILLSKIEGKVEALKEMTQKQIKKMKY